MEVAVTVVLALGLRREPEEAAEDYEPGFKRIKACRESELLFQRESMGYSISQSRSGISPLVEHATGNNAFLSERVPLYQFVSSCTPPSHHVDPHNSFRDPANCLRRTARVLG
jgi:hypothetical protein